MADPTATERLVRDLETLTNNLEFAFSGSIKPTADPIRVLQIRYVVALSAIAAFLERCDVQGDITRKFVELADAILGLRHGGATNLLRRAKTGGRGPDGHIVWGLRADVCIAHECFVRAGQNRDKAASEIADKYPEFERLKRNPGATLKGSILSWRKHITKGDVPAAAERLACEREFFEARRNLAREEIRAEGEKLLRQVAPIAAQAAI
jgi:hypothetical protein